MGCFLHLWSSTQDDHLGLSTGDKILCKVMICEKVQAEISIITFALAFPGASSESCVHYASDPRLHDTWIVIRQTAWKPMWGWSWGDRQLPAGKSCSRAEMLCWRKIHEGPTSECDHNHMSGLSRNAKAETSKRQQTTYANTGTTSSGQLRKPGNYRTLTI